MEIRVPEENKKSGVCYAVTDDGIELPVIDVTHRAFSCQLSESDLSTLVERSLRSTEKFNRMPAFVRRLVSRLVLQRGTLTREVLRAQGSYLSGMATYLLKLGPDNLGGGYATRIDFGVAASLPAVAARIRLQHMARLLADGLAPALATLPDRPLQFLNIAGGPAADSLNALLVIRREHPDWLSGRTVRIRALDLDGGGPEFGRRALSALLGEGGPLHSLDIGFDHVRYDWARSDRLGEAIGADLRQAVVACSSEGGLFEYGSDQEIVANLEALRDQTPRDAVVVGSVTRADEPALRFHQSGGAAVRPRELKSFEALVRRAGWVISQVIDAPLSHDLSLTKA